MSDLRQSHFELGTVRNSKYLEKVRSSGTFVTQNMLTYKWIAPVAETKAKK
jgi:hypothetical protein